MLHVTRGTILRGVPRVLAYRAVSASLGRYLGYS